MSGGVSQGMVIRGGGVMAVAKPVIGVIMYQTSNSKGGQELVAQRMVKWFLRLGYEAT